uniref:Uncharacterized protein n=1 Tax=Oryctolagus cuniculus TaxID=9986 RepID=A0A5F9DJS3_RABIT
MLENVREMWTEVPRSSRTRGRSSRLAASPGCSCEAHASRSCRTPLIAGM